MIAVRLPALLQSLPQLTQQLRRTPHTAAEFLDDVRDYGVTHGPRIVGILNDPRGQIAFLDTPGIHRPLHKMNVRMMEHVRASVAEADVAVMASTATLSAAFAILTRAPRAALPPERG